MGWWVRFVTFAGFCRVGRFGDGETDFAAGVDTGGAPGGRGLHELVAEEVGQQETRFVAAGCGQGEGLRETLFVADDEEVWGQRTEETGRVGLILGVGVAWFLVGWLDVFGGLRQIGV